MSKAHARFSGALLMAEGRESLLELKVYIFKWMRAASPEQRTH
jgi:hypothetical protein